MLTWLKKLFGARTKVGDIQNAFEMGRAASQSLRERIDQYLCVRGEQFQAAYLPVLRGELATLQSSNRPELQAQTAWRAFLHEVYAAERLLLTEVPEKLSDVFSAVDAIGIREQFDAYVRLRVEETCQLSAVHGAVLVVDQLDLCLKAQGQPPLSIPSTGDAGELEGLQTAFAMARAAATTARTAFAEFLERRLTPIEESYLDVLRQQFASAAKSTTHPPTLVAKADLTVFQNQVHSIPSKIRKELLERLADWYQLADQGGFRADIDDLVEERIVKCVAALEAEGDRLFHAFELAN